MDTFGIKQLLIALALFAATGAYSADVNTLLAGLHATLAATDYCRRHPSEVDAQVRFFYNAALAIRDEQNDVFDVTLYLGIEERLVEKVGLGSLWAKPITAAIVNRAAQRRGGVNISWQEDVYPVLSNVCSYLKENGSSDATIKAVLNSHEMKGAEGWAKNFSVAFAKSEKPAAPAASAPTWATPAPKASGEEIRPNNPDSASQEWLVASTTIAVKNKDDWDKAQMMEFNKDFDAIQDMVQKGEAVILVQGAHIQPIKSADWYTMWQVRELGKSDGWWLKVNYLNVPADKKQNG